MSREHSSKKHNNTFNAGWTEKDEALFYDLVKRKVSDINYDIKECTSPFVRAKLKTKKKEYKQLLTKIEQGTYNSNILAVEMASYKEKMAQKERAKHEKFTAGKYVDSYSEVSFDFDTYFRQTRYFGAALPISILLLTVLVLVVMLFSIVLPRSLTDDIDVGLQSAIPSVRLSLSSVCYVKLSEENDFSVTNDGYWPKGSFINPENAISYGTVYVAPNGNKPDTVYLYADLKMESVDITTADIVKAFFYTPLMQKYEIPGFESYLFKTESDKITWYYRFFIMGREDDIKIERNEEGKWETISIVNAVGTYGATFMFFLAIILALIEVIVCIFRLFRYTSRRFHFLPFLIIICLIMTAILPIFANIEEFTWKTLSGQLKGYFTVNWFKFLENPSVLTINFVFVIAIALMALIMLLPLFFKNRAIRRVTYVPKGNRPHTYPGQNYPTEPQGIPQGYINPKYNKK